MIKFDTTRSRLMATSTEERAYTAHQSTPAGWDPQRSLVEGRRRYQPDGLRTVVDHYAFGIRLDDGKLALWNPYTEGTDASSSAVTARLEILRRDGTAYNCTPLSLQFRATPRAKSDGDLVHGAKVFMQECSIALPSDPTLITPDRLLQGRIHISVPEATVGVYADNEVGDVLSIFTLGASTLLLDESHASQHTLPSLRMTFPFALPARYEALAPAAKVQSSTASLTTDDHPLVRLVAQALVERYGVGKIDNRTVGPLLAKLHSFSWTAHTEQTLEKIAAAIRGNNAPQLLTVLHTECRIAEAEPVLQLLS